MTELSAKSTTGLCVAPEAVAAQSGADVLRDGGNAIEACVSMAASLSVTYPHMTHLGGDSFWLIQPPGEEVRCLLAIGRSAASVSAQAYRDAGHEVIPTRGGLAAITVAGTVSGWDEALQFSRKQGLGNLPLERILSAAIGQARDGYRVSAAQAEATARHHEILQKQPGFSDVFLRQGDAPQADEILRQEALADTLQHLSTRGLDDFYRGELAGLIAADLQQAGSPLSADDLAAHRPLWVDPLRLRAGSAEVFTTPAPTQGAATLMILGQLMRYPGGLPERESDDSLHWIIEATKQAYRVRNWQIRDPALMPEPTQRLLDDERLDEMAARIRMDSAQSWNEATGAGDTTWFGCIDRDGLAVSCIQSIYHEFGSGLVLPQSGLVWQNRGISFSLRAGQHLELCPSTLPFHTLCPSLALFDDGRRMVFGAMGGDGQPQTQATLYSRYALFGQSLAKAVSAPRWLQGRTWGDESNNLKLEARFSVAQVEALRERGHDLVLVDDYASCMGHAGAIVLDTQGGLEGSADPRSDGASVAG